MADNPSSKSTNPAQEALRLAILTDNAKDAELAVASGADIDEPDFQGFTPAALGVIVGSHNALRFLLSLGADINKDGGEGSAIKLGLCLGALDPSNPTRIEWREPEMLKLLLEEGNADVDHRDAEAVGGYSLLGTAVMCYALKRMALLLQHGADVNAPVSHDTFGPLGMALILDGRGDVEQQMEMVRLLLKHGARVDFPYSEGLTAMHAALTGHNTCRKLELLLSEGHGARLAINQPAYNGATPLRVAAVNAADEPTLERRKAVALLLRHGAQIDLTDPALVRHLEMIAPGIVMFYQFVKGRSKAHEELAKFLEEHPGTKPGPDEHISLLTSGVLLLPLGGRAVMAAAAAASTAATRRAPERKGPSPSASPSPQPAPIPRPPLAGRRPLRPSPSPSSRVLGLNPTLLHATTSRRAGRQQRVVGAAAAVAVMGVAGIMNGKEGKK